MPAVTPALHITKNNSLKNVIENILVMFTVVNKVDCEVQASISAGPAWINIEVYAR